MKNLEYLCKPRGNQRCEDKEKACAEAHSSQDGRIILGVFIIPILLL
jgi:hypothetical protein